MAIIDHKSPGQRIRFYLCHWTARFRKQAEKWRIQSAQELGIAVYRFLHPEEQVEESRHVVILGDFNEEPFGLLETWLHACRERSRARGLEHYTDKSIQRARLYNCSWRLLGERFSHPLDAEERAAAGSYYWQNGKTWYTFDQVIVSGTLLSGSPPYLDERRLFVACGKKEVPDQLFGPDGHPCKFQWNKGAPVGVSDHLPICGSIVLG